MIFCLLYSCTASFGATRIPLDKDWKFHLDPAKAGEAQSWFKQAPGETEEVQLPHTWNRLAHLDHFGSAWYFKEFTVDRALLGSHLEIHFGAAASKARVWLNGRFLGEHEGGYTEFYLEISGFAKESNFLAVELNNEQNLDTIPGIPVKNGPSSLFPDWWPNGGLVRGVWLTGNQDLLVRWQHVDSLPHGKIAEVTDRVLLQNFSKQTKSFQAFVTVSSAENSLVLASAQKTVRLAPGQSREEFSLQIPAVNLWEIDNPALYRITITLSGPQGQLLDSASDRFGVRTFEIRDRHLFLNGQRVRLSGLTRHEDSPWEGLAETEGTIKYDFDDLKDLHTTLTRPVHYPQHPLIYDYADREGILMIPEIPIWQFDEKQLSNPKVIALAKNMLREMIDQNYNHPCIFAWSLENESATDTPGGIAYFKTLSALAKEMNSARMVTFADDRIAFVDLPATNASSLADFIMWNEYFGAWDGPEDLLEAAFQKIEKDYPDKMVIVSEFGYPGIFAANPAEADRKRVKTIREQLARIAEHDWIGGAILWCYQDYRSSHSLRPDQRDRFEEHGVVDPYRQRKPSYYEWKKDTEPAHVISDWIFDLRGVPQGVKITVQRRAETELPSYPLVNYRIEWRVADQDWKILAKGEKVLGEIGAPVVLRSDWPETRFGEVHLQLSLSTPRGVRAVELDRDWQLPREGGYGSPVVP
jgi:beta-glucuronidase